MAAVQDLLRLFQAVGIQARWDDRAGGCFAVRLEFGKGKQFPWGRTELVITDREDVFGYHDLKSDLEVSGFFARAYQLDAEGAIAEDDDSEGWIFCTPEDAGVSESQWEPGDDGKVVDLKVEVDEVFSAVLNYIGSVEGRKYLRLDEVVL